MPVVSFNIFPVVNSVKEFVFASFWYTVVAIHFVFNLSVTIVNDYIIYNIINVIDTLMITPLSITMRSWTSLCLLPFNIPLKLFLGVTIQDMVLHSATFLNFYIVVTLFQYAIVLLIFGISIGVVSGIAIGTFHSLIRIPNVYIDLGFITDFYTSLKNQCAQIYSTLYLFITRLFIRNQRKKTEVNMTSPVRNPGLEVAKKCSRRDSKEEIMDVASKLPSDFFQPTTDANKDNEKDRDTMSTPRESIYNTPTQSPLNTPTEARSFSEEASESDTEIWDQFDTIDAYPVQSSTVRTDATTLRTTRASKQ